MSEPPDFRLEQSELRSEDEFDEFGYEDLDYYVDFRGTFDKLPLCPDDESLAASGADVAIVGAPLDDGTSGRPGTGVFLHGGATPCSVGVLLMSTKLTPCIASRWYR